MNSSKSNILLVPAWYPASFFTEQMELVEDAFDFKILVGARHEFGKKKTFKKILNGKFKQFTWITNKSISENKDIINVDYLYVNSLSHCFERKQYQYLNKCFEKKFEELIDSGWKPDLIHIQSLNDTAVFICNWAEKNNIPVILTEHIIYIRRRFDFFQKEKERVYSRVNKVICVSNYVYRNLLTNGISVSNAEIIGNMVDDRYVSQSYESIEKNNRIIFVATHAHDKDIFVLLDAAKLLLNNTKIKICIDIVGLDTNTEFRNELNETVVLKNEILRLGLENNIFVLGCKERVDLLNMYKYYRFLVSTSVSETFGLAPAESIANGLPVVCTDSGGVRDFVNETNGIIVPIRTPGKLANKIIWMYQNSYRFNPNQISSDIIKKYGRREFANIISSIYNNTSQNGK